MSKQGRFSLTTGFKAGCSEASLSKSTMLLSMMLTMNIFHTRCGDEHLQFARNIYSSKGLLRDFKPTTENNASALVSQ